MKKSKEKNNKKHLEKGKNFLNKIYKEKTRKKRGREARIFFFKQERKRDEEGQGEREEREQQP